MTKYIKNWFSNMLPMDEPLEYEGLKYKTVENFYMAMKTLNLEDRRIISNLSARESKKYARTVELREDWEEVKETYMLSALQYKFKEGTTWHKKLMECKDDPVVEWNNWHDNIWGNCICPECKDIEGMNRLGFMLMTLRDCKEFIEILSGPPHVLNVVRRHFINENK